MSVSRKYVAIHGFFEQDEPNVVPSIVGALPARFGLLDDTEDHWSRFKHKIAKLNRDAPDGVSYKVFWIGRHGQGIHNVAKLKYGAETWAEKYAKINGDDEYAWGPDPLLTPLGEEQALDARRAWLNEMVSGMPAPEKCFCSPLRRALDTWTRTFDCDDEKEKIIASRKVIILEDCREEYGVNTCDRRSSLSELRQVYETPTYVFGEDLAETDNLWTSNERESLEHRHRRARRVYDVAFDGPETYISITTHGGMVDSFLNVVGRGSYSLPTGGVLPLVVESTINV